MKTTKEDRARVRGMMNYGDTVDAMLTMLLDDVDELLAEAAAVRRIEDEDLTAQRVQKTKHAIDVTRPARWIVRCKSGGMGEATTIAAALVAMDADAAERQRQHEQEMRDDEDRRRGAAMRTLRQLSPTNLREVFEGLVTDGICERVVESGRVRYQMKLGEDA